MSSNFLSDDAIDLRLDSKDVETLKHLKQTFEKFFAVPPDSLGQLTELTKRMQAQLRDDTETATQEYEPVSPEPAHRGPGRPTEHDFLRYWGIIENYCCDNYKKHGKIPTWRECRNEVIRVLIPHVDTLRKELSEDRKKLVVREELRSD